MRGTALAATLTGLLCPTLLIATSCISAPACQRVRPDGVIFIGTVITEVLPIPEGDLRRATALFRVDETFMGVPQGILEITVAVENSRPNKGQAYLVDGALNEGVVDIQVCGMSAPVESESARTAIDYLRARKQGKAPTSLSVQTFPAARVSIHGPAGTRSAASDDRGNVIFHDIIPGAYRVDAAREHYVMIQHRTVEILPGTCPKAFVNMVPTGSLAGRAVDTQGRPVENLSMMLSGPDEYASAEKSADAEGRFLFDHLSPGRYYLGTNLSDTRSSRYPRLYYPGARSKDAAIAIDIAPGETKTDLIFTLPDFGAMREVTLCAVDKSGRRLPDLPIDDTDTYKEIGRTDYGGLGELRTDETGCAKTKAFSQVNYRVLAAGAVAGHLWRSQKVDIPAGPKPFTALLIAEPLKYPEIIAK